MTSNLTYEIPTWNQIYDILQNQAAKIQKIGYKPDVIIAISRGGLVPARVLSDLLEVETLTTLKIEFYLEINETRTQPLITQGLGMPIEGCKILLVDDVADSGSSLKLALEYLKSKNPKEIKTATLYYKPKSIQKPDFYEIETSSWIVYPWEIKETLKELTQKYPGKQALNREIGKLIKAGLPKQLAEKLLSDLQKMKP
jgi:uncharacterized protein